MWCTELCDLKNALHNGPGGRWHDDMSSEWNFTTHTNVCAFVCVCVSVCMHVRVCVTRSSLTLTDYCKPSCQAADWDQGVERDEGNGLYAAHKHAHTQITKQCQTLGHSQADNRRILVVLHSGCAFWTAGKFEAACIQYWSLSPLQQDLKLPQQITTPERTEQAWFSKPSWLMF